MMTKHGDVPRRIKQPWRLSSLQGRLGVLFLAFALLVTISVGVTSWGIESQKKDVLVINLAGRQRMLAQQMTRLALEIELEGNEGFDYELQESARTFDQTLRAFRYGGEAPYLPGVTVLLPAPRDPTIVTQLGVVQQQWDRFNASVGSLLSASRGSPEFYAALQQITQSAPGLVQQAELSVQLNQASSAHKSALLRALQAVFFAGALLLLGLGTLVIRRSVIAPLQQLGREADRIGAGNLKQGIQATGPDEILGLASACERMRVQLQASHVELASWADTLEKRVAQRTRELEALFAVNREISSRLDIRQVLPSITDKARQLLGAEVASLCLLDREAPMLRLHASSGPQQAMTGREVSRVDGQAGEVLRSSHALSSAVGYCGLRCGILEPAFQASHLAAPLRAGEHVIGALCVGSCQANHFSGEEELLLTRLADSAAIALENAFLYSQAEKLATLEERHRIAAEMHDGLGQTLSYLGISLDRVCDQVEAGQSRQALENLEAAREMIEVAVRQARQAISSLMQDAAPHHCLQEDLQVLARELEGQAGPPIAWSTSLCGPLILEPRDSEQVLRVAREALTNALHHSHANTLCLTLECDGCEAVVRVIDDGLGFDPAAPPLDGSRQHFGLQIMQARAAHLGGSLEVRSQLGQGTQVELRWPLAQEPARPLPPQAVPFSKTNMPER